MWIYVNYPNPEFSIHNMSSCNCIPTNKEKKKENQRQIIVDNQNLKDVLKDILEGKYKFSSHSTDNDMWINVNLTSYEHSKSFVYILQAILGSKYLPLANAPVQEHNCP